MKNSKKQKTFKFTKNETLDSKQSTKIIGGGNKAKSADKAFNAVVSYIPSKK